MSASLIQKFGRTIEFIRENQAGSYVDGYWVSSGNVTQSSFVASVQNLSPSEVLMLPEGDRQKEWKKLYTTEKLNVQKEGDKFPSDKVIIDGRVFDVMKVQNYTDHQAMSITYYRADVVLDNGANT